MRRRTWDTNQRRDAGERGLSEGGSRLWGWLRRKRAPQTDRPDPAARSHPHELPVPRATVGLCFDYERDVNFDSAYLSDEGLAALLALLKRRGLRATFMCAARLCEQVPEQIRAIAEAGHELGVLGYAHEFPCDLNDDTLKQVVFRCRNAFARIGQVPIGFRAPRSKWDMRLCRELALQRFRYSAEHDHAKHPYLLIADEPALVRIPTCTDDLAFIRHPEKENETLSKHHRYLRKALQRNHFVSISYHPWILAEDPRRMDEFEQWLDAACRGGAQIGPLEEALPARFRVVASAE